MPQNSKNEKVKRERDPLPWRYCLLTLVCGLILVGGFFYAARQHFSAIEFGIKNAKLKQQKDDLESEQRRLYLTREVSFAPAEIKKAAKKIGLQEFTSKSVEFISNKVAAFNPLAAAKDTDAKDKPEANSSKTTAISKPEKAKPEKEPKDKKETSKPQNQILPNERQRVVGK